MFDRDNDLIAGSAFYGIACVAAVSAGLSLEGTGNFLTDLLFGALLVVSSLLVAGIVTIIGLLVYRFALGYDGFEEPGKLRLVLCFVAAALLVAVLLSV